MLPYFWHTVHCSSRLKPRTLLHKATPFLALLPHKKLTNSTHFFFLFLTFSFTGTNYIETLRVQIHANCRIRRIYFSDRLYSEEELPPEFKLFLPIQVRS